MVDFRGNSSNRGNIVIEGTWWILGGTVVIEGTF
jgi:hypothetical protein